MPKVLISDELSDAAVQIFRDRSVEVDFQPQLGKDKAKLAEIIGATVVAGELSLGSAIVADEWVSSHDQYGRNR